MDGEIKTNTGSPTSPLYITVNTWHEQTKKLEDNIRETAPFEGQYQSYIDSGFKLIIPDQLRHLFETGGVVTVSTGDNLMLFGLRHWSYFQRLLTKQVGLSPINNELSRHIYENMQRFDKLNDDGSIVLSPQLKKYARLNNDVAIIGMIYYAEIHDKDGYLSSQKIEALLDRKARFKKLFSKGVTNDSFKK